MSPSIRVYAAVACAALAAAGIAVAVAWSGRGEEASQPVSSAPRAGAPPLLLDVLVDDPGEASALQAAAGLYESGDLPASRASFEQALEVNPDSLYAAVGSALARWPEGSLEALERLAAEHPDAALVGLHEGLVHYWQRDETAAREAWARAQAVEPDSAAAIRAESLLHPEMAAGRPYFVPGSETPPALDGLLPLAQLDELRSRAEQEGTAEGWIHYGAALQRAGRPISAEAAFDAALAAAPESIEARTAAAIVRFDKGDPSEAFSLLGPLSADNPTEPVVQFHFGLALLWIGQVDEARPHLEAAQESSAANIWAREAALLLDRLPAE